jgi:hypothetical protein
VTQFGLPWFAGSRLSRHSLAEEGFDFGEKVALLEQKQVYLA